MLKALFDFKGSTLKKVYRGVTLLGVIVAAVITAIGCKTIVNMNFMKEALGVKKLIAGDVMLYLLKNYLVYALAVLAVVAVVFFVLRAKDRKNQAA